MKRLKERFDKSKKKGFSLLETLIAISIFLLAATGPLALAAYSISLAKIGEHQVVAYYLAEEGVEYVRYLRDTNSLKGRDWLAGIRKCLSQICYVDAVNNSLDVCSQKKCLIKYDPAYGYNYVYGEDTIFRRDIKIYPVANNNDEVNLEVSVSWNEKFIGERKVKINEHLFNWK